MATKRKEHPTTRERSAKKVKKVPSPDLDETPAKSSKEASPGLDDPLSKSIQHADILVFGNGECGQLGPEHNQKRIPAPLNQMKDIQVVEAKASGFHNAVLILNSEGKSELITWGANDDGVLGRPTLKEDELDERTPKKVNLTNIVRYSVGDYHMCALTAEGKLYGWGSYKDEAGFLGLKLDLSRYARQFEPVEFDFLHLRGEQIIDLASSSNSTVVLTASGKLWQWGATGDIIQKKSTRIKQNHNRKQLIPHPVYLSSRGRAVYGGGHHNFVVTENNLAYGWGINGFGQLGIGDFVSHERPQHVKGLVHVLEMACGDSHTLALTKEGRVYSWGRNAYGQLGHGDTGEKAVKAVECFPPLAVPKPITFFDNLENGETVVQICCGSQHSGALTNKGVVYTWGFHENCRLGQGTVDEIVPEPRKVQGNWSKVKFAKKIAFGSDHGLLVVTTLADQEKTDQ
eukprot:TRINITY_DN3876_c0_g1_i1.p1 TRINITY_DN3876_c0_g1~~TRINITY_DN3876_c0_g1_i1.p1  ORF type:complete len:458 (+),score=88.14 TRINITY_DN3876_c0_g1_i1:102-1475(+)